MFKSHFHIFRHGRHTPLSLLAVEFIVFNFVQFNYKSFQHSNLFTNMLAICFKLLGWLYKHIESELGSILLLLLIMKPIALKLGKIGSSIAEIILLLIKAALPSKVSSIKGYLPSKVIFHQRSSSIIGYLPSIEVIYWRTSSIKDHLPPKVIFNQL